MKFYCCSCAICTWKGNRPHRDGQCPVCGNALDLQIRERRHASSLATKVVLSGLSPDRKIMPSLPGVAILTDYKISAQELKVLLEAGESIRDGLVRWVSTVRFSTRAGLRLAIRRRERG